MKVGPAAIERRSQARIAFVWTAGVMMALALTFAATPAAAQSLDQLRATGAVCERPDGLLRALSSDGAVAQQVDTINRQRLAAYEKLARDTNTSVDQVRIVSGEKLQSRYGGCP
jgi:uncharacterized protein YdbL (DUF1318 family)